MMVMNFIEMIIRIFFVDTRGKILLAEYLDSISISFEI